ncbi:conserved Plasmodium protein, unknown function [Plasmodium knowlesi strain H]|uniref:C2H2-type domain-containing protein n=3 Tax=Plasmodium knowlesi TaxID=5850 RepID=A0A5K1VD34_PLAKH|nr:zinc finger protein, putative [Plasmodium knowlesi strain H]OTN65351.1 Uncharacterized protein PKNOH_S110082700 [Plasmodium knowlesi]CAA9989449.1 zinc finger protein, putative [Plasmodium knowlesi strain H]SBO25084.1 conserved Plasmodium protein, unknown function [Plasmodium knowlesi strain H]SBO27824.1 conserved Plasmodium protein, unknown function [Plasmodium knowlesi strain H]VVS78923.1 zinc finger protein, putative [Plasmodium knowlesi strain H]|eukprot:XP_002260175.1 hypothetical protein, conserved in Plasmodium species [Plasmodium knowlesi strain H]
MNEPTDGKINDRKRKKPDENTEEGKDLGKSKKKVEFENDEEYEKYLLSSFKKESAHRRGEQGQYASRYGGRNEFHRESNPTEDYTLSDMIKSFYSDLKKYKTVDDMANEIKRLAVQNIRKNLEIICNNECTSSFFVEKYRVKYINEQVELNVKSAQNYFKEFLILYNSNNFDDFTLEVNTNVEKNAEKDNAGKEKEDELDEGTTKQDEDHPTLMEHAQNNHEDDLKNGETLPPNQNELSGKDGHADEEMYKANTWKEKIKCKIENANENSNVLIKIVNYLSTTSLHIDHIPVNIKKFDVIKKLNELNYDVLNANIWDTYSSKESRPFSLSISTVPSFYRKANIYFRKHSKMTKLLSALREKPRNVQINGWYLNNVKRNIYNYVDFRICPPICSHIEVIKADYEKAKILVRKLDASCHIDADLMERIREEAYIEIRQKKRKLGEEQADGEVGDVTPEAVAPSNIQNNGDQLRDSPIIDIIEENKNLSVTKKLDILIMYLRFVHNFCYYSARKFNTYDEMVRECGYFYLRVNMQNKFYNNLIPIFYENFNVSKLEQYGEPGQAKHWIKNSADEYQDDNHDSHAKAALTGENQPNHETNPNEQPTNCPHVQGLKNKYFNDVDSLSEYQLKWLLHFEAEIKDAINANYNEQIEIEKTKEFMDILKNNYILKTTDNPHSDGKSEIRCAKCKKLFNHIKDVPNHIFIKHSQFKLKLITETEAEIMKKCFYEAPHSFHFLFMMEKKYNSGYSKSNLSKNIFKKTKNFRNQNFHLLANNAKSDYKDFDDPSSNVFEDVKQSAPKKSDFYDDT